MDTVRYIKLQIYGAFVAQIVIEYRKRHMDGKGNVSHGGEWKDWYSQGDRNILQYAERSVDLVADSDIPDGSQVRLHPYVVACSSDAAVE